MTSKTHSLRYRLKAVFPHFVTTFLRGIETYIRRMWYWGQVMRQVKGRVVKDKAKLWLSFFAAPVTALRGLDKWQNPMVYWEASVKVSGVGQFKVRAGCDDLIHVAPVREPAIFKLLRTSLKPGDVFVDAGANIGVYSVLAANLVGPAGHVIAIEMMPDTAAVLRKHIELNQLNNVKIVEKALSDKSGETVTAYVEEGLFGQASIAGELNAHGKRSVTVTTATLDDIFAGSSEIRLMKMDLEGVEEPALRGALQILPLIQNVVFESWEAGGGTVGDILEDNGFKVSHLDGRDYLAVRSASIMSNTP